MEIDAFIYDYFSIVSMEKVPSKLKLWHKVIIGMLLGIATGHFLGPDAEVLKPIGDIYLSMLKMVVIPLVFFAILYGMTSLSDTETFSRLGLRAVTIYLCTTIAAISTGILFGNIFKPGVGIEIKITADVKQPASVSQDIISLFTNIIPSNPIKAMADGNTMQVVVFAFMVGFALIGIGDRGRNLRELIVSASHMMFRMVGMVIKLTPYGVFALMAVLIGKFGFEVLNVLGKFAFVVCLALMVQYCVYGLMLSFIGLNPFMFFKKMTGTQALAFATASSKATLVTAMSELRNRIGVSKQSATFILPLGASMNMDATAIYFGVCSVFFAQIFGVDLSFTQYIIIILASTIGSIGAAGFPGGGILMMGMVLSSVGLPLDGISLILGIDRFLEMLRTMVNITGDCAVTVIVDKLEGKLDMKVYNAKEERDSDAGSDRL